MRAQEFITERKKRSKKTRGLGGYFFPGYGFYGGDAGEGSGDGGGGESKNLGMAAGKIRLYTDPDYFGAEVDDYQASGPVQNIPVTLLVGFEPDSKMQQPESRANVEKIIAGIKRGDDIPPILVRDYKDGYQILDGHHRFRAYKLLGVKSIPAQVVPDSDIEEISKPGVAEDFADGKNPGRKGLAKRSGVNTKASVSSLRKTAKNSSGEKQRMAHWLANMKAGRAKAKKK